ARVSFRTLHVSRTTTIRRVRCAPTRVAATRRHRRFHLSRGRDGNPRTRNPKTLRSTKSTVAAAWLARADPVSHLHDVPVFLRAYRRGTTPHRREPRRSSTKSGRIESDC